MATRSRYATQPPMATRSRYATQPPMATRSTYATQPRVCRDWLKGECLRKDSCWFQHRHPKQEEKILHTQQPIRKKVSVPPFVPGKPKVLCEFWADGTCKKSQMPSHYLEYLHELFQGDGFSFLTKLPGHKKGITGIVLPEKSSNLYSAAKDGTVRIWDRNSGECSKVINLGAEARCLIGKGVWVFCGASDFVWALNTECNTDFTGFKLTGPVSRVRAMEVGDDMVFAGTEEGVIYVWRGKACSDANANPFHPLQALSGHTGAVLSLRVGSIRLYSGSADHTIRVWNMDTFECVMTLNGHSDAVTSLICWTSCLLSCSLDKTIKVWSMSEGGKIEEIYTHTEEQGLLALSGMHDADSKPVLLCSSKDKSVRMYDLPSFDERGRLFAKREVHAIQIGTGGLFFTGDESGGLFVWKWSEPAVKQES